MQASQAEYSESLNYLATPAEIYGVDSARPRLQVIGQVFGPLFSHKASA
jgi:hypothetical protein